MDSGYRMDAIVEVNGNGKTIGIEVDGPFHFIGKVPSIDGIDLVSVPYWEWNKLGKDEVKKQVYLLVLELELLGLTIHKS
ncbi:hypothetical protein ACHAXM_000743 [Skeletonema potamos]